MPLCRLNMIAITLILAGSVAAQPKPVRTRTVSSRLPGTAINAMQAIKPENVETHVRFLSSDLLEGRGTGQRGGDIAAEYIAAQFALYGLKPAGDKGTYMQKVPMMGIVTLPDSTYSLIPAKGDAMTLRTKEDIVAMD